MCFDAARECACVCMKADLENGRNRNAEQLSCRNPSIRAQRQSTFFKQIVGTLQKRRQMMIVVCCLSESKTAGQLFICQGPSWKRHAIEKPLFCALLSVISGAPKTFVSSVFVRNTATFTGHTLRQMDTIS